jgi:hypothetical protein
MTTLEVLERPHSPLSPSSFERIAACTKSYQLTAATPGRRRVAGPDAITGTAVHRLLEHGLRGGRLEAVEAVRVDGQRVAVDERMRSAVEVALDWAREHLRGRRILVERQVVLPWARIAGWVDFAAIGEPWIIADFKFGYQPVAADSVQLALYAIGLLLERRRSIEGPGEVEAWVIQPRAPTAEPARRHVWTYAALRGLRDRLIGTLDRIRREDFTYSVGAHCRWCPAAATCPALAATARDAAMADLVAPELVSQGEAGAAQLDQALLMAPGLKHRIDQSWKVAEQYLLNGGKLKSHKLVSKRSGGLTVVSRDDPRPEIDVSETLKAALKSNVAEGFRTAATKSSTNSNLRIVS